MTVRAQAQDAQWLRTALRCPEQSQSGPSCAFNPEVRRAQDKSRPCACSWCKVPWAATIGAYSLVHSTADNTSLSLGLIHHLGVFPVAIGKCRGHSLMTHEYFRRILHRRSQECRVAEAKQEDPDVHEYFLYWFFRWGTCRLFPVSGYYT